MIGEGVGERVLVRRESGWGDGRVVRCAMCDW